MKLEDYHDFEGRAPLLAFDNDTIVPVPAVGSTDLKMVNMKSDIKSKKATKTGTNSRQNQGLVLRVTEHPTPTFYKDEGGKSNHLTAEVVVGMGNGGHDNSPNGRRKRSLPNGSMAIQPKLVYENGKEVEDADEIFTILSLEPKAVTFSEQPVVVKFRIEKVSRRKDGKKFRVQFDIDYDKSAKYKSSNINAAVTSSIVVLSKRKQYMNSSNGTTQKNGQRKKSKPNSSNKDDKFAVDIINKMKSTIELLERKVASLHDRVGLLETENKSMRGDLKQGNNFEPLDDSSDLIEEGTDENYVNNQVNSFQRSKNHFDKVTPLDYSDLQDEEFGFKPMMKRHKSSEFNLFTDWGPPSGPLSSPLYLADN